MATFKENVFALTQVFERLPFSWWSKRIPINPLVLVYHTVSDEKLAHISPLYEHKTALQFEADLTTILQSYSPISYEDFRQMKLGKPGKRKQVLLTFDDGLSEIYHVIAPILRKKGVPALCFLNPNFIDNQALFFRYKAALLVDQYQKNPEKFQNEKITTLLGTTSNDVEHALLSIHYHEQEVLDQVAETIGFDFASFLMVNKPYLTSEQIGELMQHGIYFGAHSLDHPEYQFLDLQTQLFQTEESILKVQHITGKSDVPFAFPFGDFGVSKTFFTSITKRFPDLLTFGYAGLKRDEQKNHVQRVPMEVKKYTAKRILLSEVIYFYLKFFVGKNKIKRVK